MKSNISRRTFISAAAGALALGALSASTVGPAEAQATQTYTEQEAKEASAKGVILHVEPAIGDLGDDAASGIQRGTGLPSHAYGGAAPGNSRLFVFGIDRGVFTELELMDGTVGARVIRIKRREGASLAPLNQDAVMGASAPESDPA